MSRFHKREFYDDRVFPGFCLLLAVSAMAGWRPGVIVFYIAMILTLALRP